MKKFIMLVGFLLSFQVNAAPSVNSAGEEEITLEDLQEEFLKEADTLVVDEEDVTFLDEEIEKKAVATGKSATTETKTTVKAPAATPIKK